MHMIVIKMYEFIPNLSTSTKLILMKIMLIITKQNN